MCRPQRFVCFRSDAVAASHVGVAIMVLTSAISGGAVYATVVDFGVEEDLEARLWDIDSDGASHFVSLEAGPGLAVNDLVAIVTTDGVSQRTSLAEAHVPALEDGMWQRGESVCVIGSSEDCLFSDGYSIKVRLVGQEIMIFEGEGILDPAEPTGNGYSLLAGESLGAVDDSQGAICHKPDTPAEKTLTLPNAALSGHTGHGDTIGACPGDSTGDDGKLVICHMPGILDLTLTIGYAGWSGHEGHGDTVGAC